MEGETILPKADAPPTIERDEPAQPSSQEIPAPTLISEPKKLGDAYLIEAPEGFVKGGTTTSAHDALMAFRKEDEERRRRIDDLEQQKVQQAGLHAGLADEIASSYVHQFTNNDHIAIGYVELHYMGRDGKDVDYRGVGDIILPDDPKFEGERVLLLFCPKCRDRGLLASHCIIQIRQSNRRWHLDERKAGEMFVDDDGEMHRSAGWIMDSERFVCGRCSWAAKIHKNKVYAA